MKRKKYRCSKCGVEASRIEARSGRWRKLGDLYQHLCIEVKDSLVEPIWNDAHKIDQQQPKLEEVPILQQESLTIKSIKGFKTARDYKVASRSTKISLIIAIEVDDALARALEEMEKTARTWTLTITSETTQMKMVEAGPEVVEQPLGTEVDGDGDGKGSAEESADMVAQSQTESTGESTETKKELAPAII